MVVNNFFDTQKDLDPCREAISLMVDQLADKLYDAGKIKGKVMLKNGADTVK